MGTGCTFIRFKSTKWNAPETVQRNFSNRFLTGSTAFHGWPGMAVTHRHGADVQQAWSTFMGIFWCPYPEKLGDKPISLGSRDRAHTTSNITQMQYSRARIFISIQKYSLLSTFCCKFNIPHRTTNYDVCTAELVRKSWGTNWVPTFKRWRSFQKVGAIVHLTPPISITGLHRNTIMSF